MTVPYLPDPAASSAGFSVDQITPPKPLDYQSMSYDEILNLITLIDQGELDSQLTPAQMEELSDIMCAVADKGSDPTDPMNALLLQEDIYALQCGMRSDFQDTFFNESHDLFAVIPVAYYGKAQGLLCKEGDFQ